MYFTREPIIETVITPKEGYKLVLRSSKGTSQEEFFVDAVEVISFGKTCFFRSLEKPKAFLVPVSDYEVVEVREARMVLKSPGVEKGIKIAGGREALLTTSAPTPAKAEEKEEEDDNLSRVDRRRDRRRGRKRKVREDVDQEVKKEESKTGESYYRGGEEERQTPEASVSRERPVGLLIPPPTTLISETLSRYKDTPLFAGAFYGKEEKEGESDDKKSDHEETPEEEQEEDESILHEKHVSKNATESGEE